MTEVKGNPPPFTTGVLRYDFQVACTKQAIAAYEARNGPIQRDSARAPGDALGPRLVLNVGCNEDPSHLRQTFGRQVVNCDREGYDEHMRRPNVVDCIFDALEFPWPFEDDSMEMVLLGDILEHFPLEQSVAALTEARRIARTVCVTVPEDTRIDEAAEHARWQHGVYNLHTKIITRDVLQAMFDQSGWELDWVTSGLWGIGGDWGPEGITGWCARAHRPGEGT